MLKTLNLKKLLKCLFAIFLSVVCVFVSSYAVYVYADGIGDGTPQDNDIRFSYWNIDSILAYRQDGVQVIYDFPTDYFYTSTQTVQTINLKGRVEGVGTVEDEMIISFYTGTFDDSGIEYVFMDINLTFASTAYTNYEISWINNVIHPSNSIRYSLAGDDVIGVPYFRFLNPTTMQDQTNDVVTSFYSKYSNVQPNNNYPLTYSFSNGTYTELMPANVGDFIDPETYYALIMPQDQLDALRQAIINRGYPSYTAVPYIDYAVTIFSTNFYAVQNMTLQLLLPIGTCERDLGYQTGATRVSIWYEMFAHFSVKPDIPSPSDPTMPNDVAAGAVSFFARVLTGIFSIEMFPQIFIGGIVFAILAIMLVFVVLRFFNGG